ncbi:MAG: hypothetical protein ACRYFX_02150 [Janthinobacterium lividum]
MQVFTALDFIDAYLDLKAMSPEVRLWSEKGFISNPPRLYRFQRLVALAQALGLPTSFDKLETGEFLAERPLELYSPLLSEADEYLHTAFGFKPRSSRSDLSLLCQQLLRFLEQLRQITRFNSGWLEASSRGALYSIKLTEVVIDSLGQEPVAHLRGVLAHLLDPYARQFTQSELVRRFGFPVVDLLDVDIDWM